MQKQKKTEKKCHAVESFEAACLWRHNKADWLEGTPTADVQLFTGCKSRKGVYTEKRQLSFCKTDVHLTGIVGTQNSFWKNDEEMWHV